MRRVAFLRSIEVQQTDPYLRALAPRLAAEGIEARLYYTDGVCAPGDFPGDSVKLPQGVSCGEVVERLLEWDVDGVISLSIPDENALRDALVKSMLEPHGIPMVMHEVETTRWFSHKWDTKELVRSFGLSSPAGILLDGDILNGRNLPVPAYFDYVIRKGAELGYPLLSKPLWDCLANGVTFIEDEAALVGYYHSPYSGSTVLEQCLTGELCSVELVARDGVVLTYPLVWKGTTGGDPAFLFGQLRYCAPRPEADAAFAPVGERLRQMCRTLGVDGSLEVEMIYADGTYHVIEVNPRVSGTTTLSIAATGCNSYECLLDMLLGRWTEERVRPLEGTRRLALQFPVDRLDADIVARLDSVLDVVRASTFHIDGNEHSNAVVTCEYDDASSLAGRVDMLAREFGLVEPSIVSAIDEIVTAARPVLGAQRVARERVALAVSPRSR